MAIQQIEYDDKVAINIDSTIPDINKCNASDMNEIKSVVNGNSYETPKVSSQVDTNYKVNVLTTKNLFNKDNVKDGYYINSSGVETSSIGYWNISNYIKVEPNTDYTYQGLTNAGSDNVQSAYYDINEELISVFKQKTGTNTITTPNNCYYVRFSIYEYQSTDKDTFMFEQGNQATTYEPFIQNTINVNNEKYTDTINVGTSINDKNRVNVLYSKNLLPYPYTDTTKTTNGITFTDNGDGTITISGTASANASFRLLGDSSNQYNIDGNYISGGVSANRRIQVVHYNPGYTVLGNSTGSPSQINKSTYTTGYIEIVIASGEAITTPITIKPMLTMKSDDVYEQYVGSPSINIDGEEIYNANVMNYSLNEERLGTWIDGKPLYRKYIKVEGIPNSASKTVQTGISNVDFIKIDYGNSYCSWSLPRIYPINRSTIETLIDSSKNINITTTGSYGDSWFMYVLVQYTKTTD